MRRWTPLLVSWLCVATFTAHAQLWINEILFNPPTGANVPDQYIELRGPANLVLTNVYLVAVEGDAEGNPGTVQNIFDLDGQRIGANGFLVLLQNSNSYAVNPLATKLVNTGGPGFGSGSSSSIDHHGKSGHVALEAASTTFLLIQTTNALAVSDDIDADNDGFPDGPVFAGWTVLDSVGVLDNDGVGDFAYGKVNFRRAFGPGTGAMAWTGTVVPVDFTPGYVARLKNSTGSTATDWLAADDLLGAAPAWKLNSAATSYAKLGNKPLNHVGSPNFGGARLPGVIVRGSGLEITEGGAARSYSIALNLKAAGGLVVQIAAPPGVEVSVNRGKTYGPTAQLKLTGVAPKTVFVRVAGGDDDVVDAFGQTVSLTHSVASSGDPANYPPSSTFISPLEVRVNDNEWVVMSEVKANAPGEDAPFEFVELRGTPNALLTNLYFVVLEGNLELNPGLATTVIDLTGTRLGANGHALIVAPNSPYFPAAGTTVVTSSELSRAGGALGDGAVTFALIQTATPIVQGTDLDAGDNGRAEGFGDAAVFVDSLAWRDGSHDDQVYTKAVLSCPGTPEAATRFSTNNTPNTASAWFGGALAGTAGESLTYNVDRVTDNFPFGTAMSPGVTNNTAPIISPIAPFTATIGDPTTPVVAFTIGDPESPINALTISVHSTNAVVLPDDHIVLGGSGTQRTLKLQPIGVGYSRVTISVSDGAQVGMRWFDVAASEDLRGGGRFHSGASDASTAYAIDGKWMVVGDDETQVLRLFSRSNSGPAIATLDMNPYLGLLDFYDNGDPKEVDIEASTHVGDRIFWLGSHSHTGDTEIATNRARMFATDIAGSGTNIALKFIGRYDYLKYDLLNWDAHGEHGKSAFYYGLGDSSREGVDPKSPDGSGFNIEGLAMAPNDTMAAYVAFRAPLVPPSNRVKALIIPVTNFATLAVSGAAPGRARFGAPIELNLGGRGIRSIEGSGTNFLIVAGPPGLASNTPPYDFKLFTWTGRPEDQPQLRAADLTGLNPEAIVELPKLPWTSNARVQLLSDNGVTVYYGDGIQAKHVRPREFKKARTDWVTLGAIVPQTPLLRSPLRSERKLRLTWHAVAGTRYRIQAKAGFDSAWHDIAGDVIASDATATKEVEPTDEQRFFRVVAVE